MKSPGSGRCAFCSSLLQSHHRLPGEDNISTETFIYVLATNIITLLLSSLFYATRVYELRVEHVREKAEINQDFMMQREVYGQVSMENLMGYESFGDKT